MAVFTSTTAQTVSNGNNVAFTSTAVRGGCSVLHREGSGLVTVRGSGNCCNPARYRISFNGTVTGVAGAIQLVITQSGENLGETLMSVVPAATTDVWSISTSTEIVVPCDCATIGVKSVTASDITVNTASIAVTRTA